LPDGMDSDAQNQKTADSADAASGSKQFLKRLFPTFTKRS